MDMDDTPLEGGASRRTSSVELYRILGDHRGVVLGKVADNHGSKEVTSVAEAHRLLSLAEPHSVLGHRLEHRLEIEGGPPDHLEELAGRRLLLERDSQLAVTCLELLEQTHVLEGNHGLVGERLKERDLFVAERSRLTAPDADRPRRLPLAEDRHGEDRA